jgi:hypothetical protein
MKYKLGRYGIYLYLFSARSQEVNSYTALVIKKELPVELRTNLQIMEYIWTALHAISAPWKREVNRHKRLAWAHEHLNWTMEQ